MKHLAATLGLACILALSGCGTDSAPNDNGATVSAVAKLDPSSTSLEKRRSGGTGRAINRPPSISGTPANTVVSGQPYYFAPTASDPDRNALTFIIQNMPTWATFSTQTGVLSGTPGLGNVGTSSGIVISVSDGNASAALPTFTITVTAPAQTNRPPTISGTPPSSIVVGAAYSFQPAAADPDGDALSYAIQNKPAWAAFDTLTGRLSGTPTTGDAGTFSSIVISVSDGAASAALAAFSVVVTQAALGSAQLNWTAPSRNVDGSDLATLAGYRIYYGVSPTTLTQSVTIANPGVLTYLVENLSPGTWYFAIKSYESGGAESALSNVVNRTL